MVHTIFGDEVGAEEVTGLKPGTMRLIAHEDVIGSLKVEQEFKDANKVGKIEEDTDGQRSSIEGCTCCNAQQALMDELAHIAIKGPRPWLVMETSGNAEGSGVQESMRTPPGPIFLDRGITVVKSSDKDWSYALQLKQMFESMESLIDEETGETLNPLKVLDGMVKDLNEFRVIIKKDEVFINDYFESIKIGRSRQKKNSSSILPEPQNRYERLRNVYIGIHKKMTDDGLLSCRSTGCGSSTCEADLQSVFAMLKNITMKLNESVDATDVYLNQFDGEKSVITTEGIGELLRYFSSNILPNVFDGCK